MTESKLAVAITPNKTVCDNIGNIFAIAVCKDKEISEIAIFTATSDSQEKRIAELKAQNIEAILCKKADYQTLTYLEDFNIQAFRITEDTITVEEALKAKLNHKLAPVRKMFTCGGACDF